MEKMKKPVYHFISHSHWDREWYKTFETFRLDLVDMINSLLNIFKTNPDYKHFTLDGQAVILEDYAEIMPDKIDELKNYIREGKILIGPWYILADQFLVSGESTVRNLLIGKKTCEKFDGAAMEVGYLPDSFGHIAMMPAILRNFDITNTVLFRGFGGECGQEKSEYLWCSPDGSQVLMSHLPPNGYGDAYIGNNSLKTFLKKGQRLKDILDPRATTQHRLCMNGGDHHFPEHFLPRALAAMSEKIDGNFIHSSLVKYFDAVSEYLSQNSISLPQIKGELRWGYRYAFSVNSGIYSTRIYLKQANYSCEKLLTRYSEPLAVWASLTGRKNLFTMLEKGWKTLLLNHAHDSICGCSIDEVHVDMEVRFKKCRQIGQAVINKSIQQLFPDSPEKTQTVFVFNPLARDISHPVMANIEFFRQRVKIGLDPNIKIEPKQPLVSGFNIIDTNGKNVSFQIIKHNPETGSLKYSDYSYPLKHIVDKYTVLLDCQQVPGLGFACYSVKPAKIFPEYRTNLIVGDRFLENDYLRIEILDNGSIRLLDKRTLNQLHGLHIFEDGGDAGDCYNYSYPPEDKIVTSENSNAKIRVIETGPLRGAIKINLEMNIPESLDTERKRRMNRTISLPISTIVYLYYDQPRIEFITTIDNNIKDHRLRVIFPTLPGTSTSFADAQFNIIRREHYPVNPEDYNLEIPSSVHPMQRGVTIIEKNSSFTLATEGLPEYELKTGTPGALALTLLRCVGRLSGGDLITRPGGEAGWISGVEDAQCLGKHRFRYAIIPHSPDEFRDYNFLNEQIEAFNYPCLAFSRRGKPAVDFRSIGLNISPSALIFSAFKKAENKKGSILRFYNPTNKDIEGTIGSPLPIKNIWLTQLNEKDIFQLPSDNGDTFNIRVKPYNIITLRLQFSN